MGTVYLEVNDAEYATVLLDIIPFQKTKEFYANKKWIIKDEVVGIVQKYKPTDGSTKHVEIVLAC